MGGNAAPISTILSGVGNLGLTADDAKNAVSKAHE
jgi:hypothetical protein